MKSDVCKLTKDAASLSAVLSETEKAAAYAGLDHKQTNRMRLLAEELIGMLPELLAFSNGEFWVESDGKEFELHAALTPDDAMTMFRREQLLSVSKSGKNIAAKGIMNKIRLAAQFMMLDYDSVAERVSVPLEFYRYGMIEHPVWSLEKYSEEAKKAQGEPWDELEKSIIANIADDVLVGVQGKRVDIIVKKAF
ncbi:MAG: hypothetical protein IKQ61_07120 [Spirochaetales bacterium]|nr:hypothetical protein [Spirochaetales bacterium]MBR6200012.1 hypothetical protein [Spirochaetales bacterium]